MPSLLALYPLAPLTLINFCSVAIIFVSSSYNTFLFIKSKKLNHSAFNIMLYALPLMATSSYASSIFLAQVDQRLAKFLIGLTLFTQSIRKLYLFIRPKKSHEQKRKSSSHLRGTQILIMSLVGGVLPVLTGLGGGVLFIPLLYEVFKKSQKDSIMWSNLFMSLSSLIATVTLGYQVYESRFTSLLYQNLHFDPKVFISIVSLTSLITSFFLIKKKSHQTNKWGELFFIIMFGIIGLNIMIKTKLF